MVQGEQQREPAANAKANDTGLTRAAIPARQPGPHGLDIFLPYEKRQATAKALLERGYADRIFLSADSVATTDWFPSNVIEQLIASGAANEWTIRIVPERVLPELREAGMTDQQERTMMVDNAVRWLTG